jgi:O-antigen/teichoic acid export membrane protein
VTATVSARRRRRRGGDRQASKIAGAIAGQGIQAVSSLVFQLVAVRTLGDSRSARLAEFGRFSILVGLLITLSALLAGFRDASIVHEVSDPHLRPVANSMQFVMAVVAAGIGFVFAATFASADPGERMWFALVVLLWVLEEAGRRHFIARMHYGSLVINDMTYLSVAVGGLALRATLDSNLDITALLQCMAAGSAASFVLGLLVQLGPRRFSVRGTTRDGIAEVTRFAIWRSLHGLTTPAQVFLLRYGVSVLVATAAVGVLEAGRVLIAPGFVVVSGFSTFLLPTFARLRGKWDAFYRYLRRVVVFMALAMAALSALFVLLYEFLAELLLGDAADEVTLTLVVSWVLMLSITAISQPVGVSGVAMGRTRQVFAFRLADSAVGLIAALLLAEFVSVDVAPLGLATGSIVGTALLWRHTHEHRPRGPIFEIQ